jgi:hypothetical protein
MLGCAQRQVKSVTKVLGPVFPRPGYRITFRKPLALDKVRCLCLYYMSMASHSVKQAAKLLGVDPQTLFRWIWNGKVRPSIAIPMNGRKLYRFTDKDVTQVRRYKSAHYWEGRGGSKPKSGRGKTSRRPNRSRKKEKK